MLRRMRKLTSSGSITLTRVRLRFFLRSAVSYLNSVSVSRNASFCGFGCQFLAEDLSVWITPNFPIEYSSSLPIPHIAYKVISFSFSGLELEG